MQVQAPNASNTNNYNFTNTNNTYTQPPSVNSTWSSLPLLQQAILQYLNAAPGRGGDGMNVRQIVHGVANTKAKAPEIA